MKKLAYAFVSAFIFLASCQKCYECKQYCSYCVPPGNTGVAYKVCATKDVTHAQIDSVYSAMQSSGYTCSKLINDKRVCDGSNKLNDAVDYYERQDYYCFPQ